MPRRKTRVREWHPVEPGLEAEAILEEATIEVAIVTEHEVTLELSSGSVVHIVGDFGAPVIVEEARSEAARPPRLRVTRGGG